jgi:SAM-dependent methyltransferase
MSDDEVAAMGRHEQRHWWFQSKQALVQALLRRFIGDHSKPSRVLDAGCGTGLNLTMLRAYGRATGVDISPVGLNLCQASGQRSLARVNLKRLPFHDGSFDVITSLDVLEHIDDPEAVLRELRRVLSADGVVIITLPAFKHLWSEHDVALSHFRRYNRPEIEAIVRDWGFDVEHSGYFFAGTYPVVAMIRWLRGLLTRRSRLPRSDTHQPPVAWLNALLKWMMGLEARCAARWRLPFGSTVFVVLNATKSKTPIDRVTECVYNRSSTVYS